MSQGYPVDGPTTDSRTRRRDYTEGSVSDVRRWCRDGDFSRTWLYGEWAVGRGPKRVRIGSRVKILESPREYCERVAREQMTATTHPARK
jgi:hypothetical protein